MSLKDVGDGIAKYWAIILFCLGGICWASIVYADVNAMKTKVNEADRRFQRIEWFLIRIGEKMNVRFEDK
jgi:hypothetical protein